MYFHRFISISESLPKTGSIKMIEIWMLFSLLIPFIEVVLQTYRSHLLQRVAAEAHPQPAVGIASEGGNFT